MLAENPNILERIIFGQIHWQILDLQTCLGYLVPPWQQPKSLSSLQRSAVWVTESAHFIFSVLQYRIQCFCQNCRVHFIFSVLQHMIQCFWQLYRVHQVAGSFTNQVCLAARNEIFPEPKLNLSWSLINTAHYYNWILNTKWQTAVSRVTSQHINIICPEDANGESAMSPITPLLVSLRPAWCLMPVCFLHHPLTAPLSHLSQYWTLQPWRW